MQRREPANFRCKCGRIAFCLENRTDEPVCKELLLLRCGRHHIWKIDNTERRHRNNQTRNSIRKYQEIDNGILHIKKLRRKKRREARQEDDRRSEDYYDCF